MAVSRIKLPRERVATPGKIPLVLTVSRTVLIDLLNEERAKYPLTPIPKNAVITIQIPSGGDYSGEKLEIEQLEVRWDGHLPDA